MWPGAQDNHFSRAPLPSPAQLSLGHLWGQMLAGTLSACLCRC